MKVAYVCPDRGVPFLGTKGASVHAREITRSLQNRGHEVTSVVATLGEGNEAPDISDLLELPEAEDERERFLEEVFEMKEVEAVIERYSLEVGPARRASEAAHLPLVLEVNAPIVLEAARYRGYTDVDQGLERERSAFSTADGIAVVSSALERYVLGQVPDAHVRVVPNGVDIDRFEGVEADDLGLAKRSLVVGFAGSMKPWHGVTELLDAFLQIRGLSDLRLVFAGSGPLEDELRTRARTSAFGDVVHFLGSRSYQEMPRILARFDIAAAPYRPSPDFYMCPIKIFEYMAAGTPVVFPEIGDLPELLDGAGLGFRPGSVDDLAGSIEKLAIDEDLRTKLGRVGRRRASAFTWDEAAAKLESLLAASSLRAATGTPR